MSLAHHAGTPVEEALLGHDREECLGLLRVDSLRQEPAGAFAQTRCQGIVACIKMGKRNQRWYLFSWRITPSRGCGYDTPLDTSPSSNRHHPVSAIA